MYSELTNIEIKLLTIQPIIYNSTKTVFSEKIVHAIPAIRPMNVINKQKEK